MEIFFSNHSVFLRRKRQFIIGGPSSLRRQYLKIDPGLRALEEENATLKKTIGNQTLELESMTEILKKNEAYEWRLKGLLRLGGKKADQQGLPSAVLNWTPVALITKDPAGEKECNRARTV